MSAKLKVKRGTTASWADSANKDTTLEPGQIGVEYVNDQVSRIKVGKNTTDGSATDWADLPYVAPRIDTYKEDGIFFSPVSNTDNINIARYDVHDASNITGTTTVKNYLNIESSTTLSALPTSTTYGYDYEGNIKFIASRNYRSKGSSTGSYDTKSLEMTLGNAWAANATNSSTNTGLTLRVTDDRTDKSTSTGNTFVNGLNLYIHVDPDSKSAGNNCTEFSLNLGGSVGSDTNSYSSIVASRIPGAIYFCPSTYGDESAFIGTTDQRWTAGFFNGLDVLTASITKISNEMIVDNLIPNASNSKTLGDVDYYWNTARINSVYTSKLSAKSGSISIVGNTTPGTNSTSTTTGYTLGSSSYKWRYLYAFSGTIQTSDRSAKDSIHYIESSENNVMTLALDDETSLSSNSEPGITMEDVLDFVATLNPATFCYKSGQGEDVEATEENSDPEEIQLGLIADDIKDHPLFKYVGVETECEEEITPAVEDDEGNIITPAVTETKTTRGLQAIPLATAALTACKYLLNKMNELDARIAELESK